MNFTPEKIERLLPNEVFVFGSNTSGSHGAGAAKAALGFGAVMGQGFGPAGQTYAIATLFFGKAEKQGQPSLLQLPLSFITHQLCGLLAYVVEHPNNRFYLTKIGTGIGGFGMEEMGRALGEALRLCDLTAVPHNLSIPKEFWAELSV